MRGREMLDTIENLNPAFIEAAAEPPTKKKYSWRRWSTVAACLCICILGAFLFLPRPDPGGFSGGDLTLYELTLIGDDLYFTDPNGGVFQYTNGADQPQKLASFKGTLTQTSSGLYCTDYRARIFYQIVGAELQKLVEVDSGELVPWFIDRADDYAYWCTSDYVEGADGDRYNQVIIYRTNLSTEETALLFTESVSIHKPEYISQGRIYYETYRGVIKYYDIATGSTQILNDEFSFDTRGFQIRDRTYYDDYILFDVDETFYDAEGKCTGMILSLYRMPYDGTSAVKLTDISPGTFMPARVGDKLYYTAMLPTKTGGRLAFVSCNINTGEVVELTEYPEELSNMAMELAVHEDGFYITNPSYTNGGLFFYNSATGEFNLIYE